MSMDKLLEFRTMYLRAVAEAWIDPKFRHELTSKGGAIAALQKRFDYKWPWPRVCDLEINEAGGKYEWIDNQWVWSSSLRESLTMPLPLVPEVFKISEVEQAAALADYYRQRASLFSDDWDKTGASGPTGGLLGDASGLSGAQPPGGFMGSDNEYAAFKVALLAVIAKAWREPSFRETLIIDPATALHTIRDYTLPWKFTVIVTEDKESKWLPDLGNGQSGWRFLGKNTLSLNLPTGPREVHAWPVALAAYNATGAEYPFSCCT
jgi:ribosomally synthesized peptide (two-chain TOMM family)